MANSVARGLNAVVGRILPERQIFIRSEDRSRLLLLTPMAQLGAVAVLGIGLAWSVFATVKTIENTAEIERLTLEQAAVERAWASRYGAATDSQSALETQLAGLSADHRLASAALSKAETELVEAQAALRAADVERRALKRGIERLQLERTQSAARAAELEVSLREARLALIEGVGESKPSLASPDLMSSTMMTHAMGTVVEERDRALREIASLDAEVATLTDRLDRWQDQQDLVLGKVETAARAGLDGLTKVLERANLDIDDILDATRGAYYGEGGPFVPLTEAEAELLDEAADDERLAALMGDLERVNLLRVAVNRLPFGLPVIGARLTSAFGKRRDPFGRGWSMHNGVDYAGPIGTPITSTADGVVSFAGRMRGYGRIVIVKHAFGYETRYAHLHKMLVKVGDRVSRGERIALMGNSGRSTGSHLHYEIRIDKDPINPKKFIEATRDVL